MARPTKSPLEQRSRFVTFRVTEAEHAAISDKAETSRKPLSDFARASVMGKRVAVQPSNIPDFTTRHELRRIGVNLNQIARVLNAGGNHNAEELSALTAKLDTLFDRWLSNDTQSREIRPQL